MQALNNSCDILLISPFSRRYWIYQPYALIQLSSYLKASGISVKIFDFKQGTNGILISEIMKSFKTTDMVDNFYEKVFENVRNYRPKIIGLTSYTVEYSQTLELARLLKDKFGIPIVVGGVHATLRPDEFIYKGSPIDYAVVGEGETPLKHLVNAVINKTPIKSIESISYYDENNNPVISSCNVEEDISNNPMSDYESLDMMFYMNPHTGFIRNLLLNGIFIFTSRGCPYDCTFCAVNYLKSKNSKMSKIRYRNIDNIINEIEYLKNKYKIDSFYIADDCFMVSKKRTIEFCEKLQMKKLNLLWGAETRVNLINDENIIKLMRKSGLMQLDFGVESGSNDMLKEINKEITIEQTEKAFSICKNNSVRAYANILFNLPNETAHDIQLTEELLNKIKATGVGMAVTVPHIETGIYNKYVFPKLTKEEYDIYSKNVYCEIVDGRFKFAKHGLSFKSIISRLDSKHNKMNNITFDYRYWLKVLGSRYLIKYINNFLIILLDIAAKNIVLADKKYCKSYLKKTTKSMLFLFKKK